ncbi:MAG: hypothetical protein Q4F31_01990 [Eubacteriales bacterium]|nr:hypothetical protein [Eubacteriales bacterium]
MKQYFEIADVTAREVFAAGGASTVEVDITLDDSTVGRASVPAGMANGSSVTVAVDNVNIEISEALLAMDALSQPSIDKLLLELDGTSKGTRLGANALMAASLACAKAAAESAGISVYNYIGGVNAKTIPPILPAGETVSLSDFATLTQLLDEIRKKTAVGEKIILSAGMNESDDPVLADLAVAVNADGIVTSSVSVCNQLLRIEEELFDVPEYPER